MFETPGVTGSSVSDAACRSRCRDSDTACRSRCRDADGGGVPNASAACLLLVSIFGLGSAWSQSGDFADFRAQANEALGGEVRTIEIAGHGWDACLGQAWSVNDGWARWELTDYRRVIDYAAGTSLQTAMRRAGLDPERIGGCGGQVDARATPQRTSIAGDAGFAAQLSIWLTPHGFLALGAQRSPSIERTSDGFRVTTAVRDDAITHRVVAEYDVRRLPRRITTWIDDPIFGDMEVVAEFGAYRNFGGVLFPETLKINQGGMATFELIVDAVTPGVASPELPPPRNRRTGSAADGPAYSEIGDGVFVMHGAYQAVAVEFDEFAVVIDGMQSDARTAEVIRLTREAIPGKPIRYVVNTHSHFDHASGLRQFAAEGTIILTHAMNVEFFREALSTPRTLNADLAEPARVTPRLEGVSERLTIRDESGRRIDVLALRPSQHAADMLVAYLPQIGTIVESDLLQPWINPIFAGDGPGPHPYLQYLYEELERLDLDYAQFVPIHVPPEPPTMPRSALEAVMGL